MSVGGSRKAWAGWICASWLLVFGPGCASLAPGETGRISAESWGRERGFSVTPMNVGGFALLSLVRHGGPAGTLTVYIEGDGAPWASPYHPPRDPTPREPMALALAGVDGATNVAWLARPCQYLSQRALHDCDKAYWVGRRFAPEVIDSFDQALTQLKAGAGAHSLRLVGYSGGGVIAVLLGMRRHDVQRVVTIAAPLSLDDWLAWHQLSPLPESLDPMRQVQAKPALLGVHFAGERDSVVPVAVVERFVRSHGGRLETVAGFDHDCCWVRHWQRLLQQTGALEFAP